MVVSLGIYNIAPVRVVTQATLLRCPSRTHDDRMNWQVQLSRAPAARFDPFSCVTAVSLTVVPSLLIIRTLIIRTPSSLVT